jgi:FAD/FMN-containing dehydrogenase
VDTAVERGLVEAVGQGAILDGGRVAVPSSHEQVVAVARVCSSSRTPLAVVSGRPADGAPGESTLLLSLSRLTAIRIERGSGTLYAEAGASLGDVRAAAEREGLALVGPPAHAEGRHVGAVIARGEVPRRALTGVDLVLASGDAVRSGGAVLKDVTGYDLVALALGSLGRLAIIVAAHFRLQPAAARGPAFPPAGHHGRVVGPALVGAFDPEGLLRAPS